MHKEYHKTTCMKTKLVVALLGLSLFFILSPALAQQCQPIRGPVLALEIANPEGSVYIDMFRESDGPVRVPVQSAYADSLQISTRIESPTTLSVVIHSVTDSLTVNLIGSYEMDLPAEFDPFSKLADLRTSTDDLFDEIQLYELESLDLDDWVMRLTILRPSLNKQEQSTCECCSCGGLYCCPNAGKCIGCGSCGDCCCTGGVE